MATKTVQIILSTIGANIGPEFNIYDDVDGFTTVRCGPIPTASFLPPDGYDCTLIDDAATQILLVEVGGVCEVTLLLDITECTTTTTSTSSSTTTTTSTSSTTTTTTTAAPGPGDCGTCTVYWNDNDGSYEWITSVDLPCITDQQYVFKIDWLYRALGSSDPYDLGTTNVTVPVADNYGLLIVNGAPNTEQEVAGCAITLVTPGGILYDDNGCCLTTTTTTAQPGCEYPVVLRLGNTELAACEAAQELLYMDTPVFGLNTHIYTDCGVTLITEIFAIFHASGVGYNIVAGEVVSTTGNSC